ncbi:MAG TPA: cytochrome c biogenesis protein CcsA [Tepidisphaeraceae bacterium]|jgi:cytochrome c-type biogenesis protein CcsB
MFIRSLAFFLAFFVFALSARATDSFADSVDVSQFEKVAIQHEQTIKTFDTFSRQVLEAITGRGSLDGRPATFTVLDMAFDPQAYLDKPIIKIKNLPVRLELRDDLVRMNAMSQTDADAMVRSGMISLNTWKQPGVVDAMRQFVASDNRRAQAVAEVETAGRSLELLGQGNFMIFNLVPPAFGDTGKVWASLGELSKKVEDANGQAGAQPLAGYNLPELGKIGEAFNSLADAWKKHDAAAVNTQLDILANTLPQLNPERYPSLLRRQVEVVYNHLAKLTLPGAAFYFVAFVLFLMSARAGVNGMRLWALRFFIAGFLIHTVGIAVRWWLVAGQHDNWFDGIPIKNEFESVLMSAWFGCLVGLVLELRKSRGIFGAAASFVGWLALVAIFSVPHVFGREIGGEIGQVNGVLMSYWLYIHVTMATASYALIGMSFILGVWWLAIYMSQRKSIKATGYQLSADAADNFLGGGTAAIGFTQTLAMMFFVKRQRAATMEIQSNGTMQQLATLDACNVVVLQLAFWILGTAIVLGAVWADESWGRPWGWDPKETFALVTWIVYLIIVHVRLITEHKAYWTAFLSILGFFVMLFNWIGVNFWLVGLHSYA